VAEVKIKVKVKITVEVTSENKGGPNEFVPRLEGHRVFTYV
jgi:hypothetical protein